jgi:hypothetical protein
MHGASRGAEVFFYFLHEMTQRGESLSSLFLVFAEFIINDSFAAE